MLDLKISRLRIYTHIEQPWNGQFRTFFPNDDQRWTTIYFRLESNFIVIRSMIVAHDLYQKRIWMIGNNFFSVFISKLNIQRQVGVVRRQRIVWCNFRMTKPVRPRSTYLIWMAVIGANQIIWRYFIEYSKIPILNAQVYFYVHDWFSFITHSWCDFSSSSKSNPVNCGKYPQDETVEQLSISSRISDDYIQDLTLSTSEVIGSSFFSATNFLVRVSFASFWLEEC